MWRVKEKRNIQREETATEQNVETCIWAVRDLNAESKGFMLRDQIT